jgi:hypothetical protein
MQENTEKPIDRTRERVTPFHMHTLAVTSQIRPSTKLVPTGNGLSEQRRMRRAGKVLDAALFRLATGRADNLATPLRHRVSRCAPDALRTKAALANI